LRLLIFLLSALLLGLATQESGLVEPHAAQAKEVKLSGTHSQEAVFAACRAAGGMSWTTAPSGGGRYGCENKKKGTSVDCTPGGECTGEVPDRRAIPPGTHNILSVLTGFSVQPGGSKPPGPGLLEGTTGFNQQGPSSTGKPAAPAEPSFR
jgi:hypothetical protein